MRDNTQKMVEIDLTGRRINELVLREFNGTFREFAWMNQ
jgi:hypothetical protein